MHLSSGESHLLSWLMTCPAVIIRGPAVVWKRKPVPFSNSSLLLTLPKTWSCTTAPRWALRMASEVLVCGMAGAIMLRQRRALKATRCAIGPDIEGLRRASVDCRGDIERLTGLEPVVDVKHDHPNSFIAPDLSAGREAKMPHVQIVGIGDFVDFDSPRTP